MLKEFIYDKILLNNIVRLVHFIIKEIEVNELKINKTIIITIAVGTVLAFISGFVTYQITINNQNNSVNLNKSSKSLKVGDYSLQFGTYKGYNIEYDWDDKSQKMIEKSRNELILKLNSNNTYELSGEKHKFSVVGLDIIVPDFNNNTMIKVVGNNKIMLQIGSGIEMTYSK